MEDRGQYIKLVESFSLFLKEFTNPDIYPHIQSPLFGTKGRQKSIVATIGFPIKNIFIFSKTDRNSDIFLPSWTGNGPKSQDSKFEEIFLQKQFIFHRVEQAAALYLKI